METLWQDLRYAVRQLAHNRGTTVVAGLTLALGIAASTSMFALLPARSLRMVVPVIVLVVACANAANVLLARGLSRRKEFAMRRALGATRARLVVQLITENVLLSLGAGVAGALLSWWLTALVSRLGAVAPAVTAALTPDGRVVTWTLAIAIATGVGFGIAPALAATQPPLAPALKEEGAMLVARRHRHRLRDAFVVGQIAVSLVLLITAQMHGAADTQQAAAAVLTVFGSLGLTLAALGTYAVTAHGVTLRAREIGIRMSLGAGARDVRRLFVREGLARGTAGVVLGLALSATVLPLLAGSPFGLRATGAATFIESAFVLCGVAVAASYIPARRAARVDPMVALRSE